MELVHWSYFLEVIEAVESWQEHWETREEGLGQPHWTEALILKVKHGIKQIQRLAVQNDEVGSGWLLVEDVTEKGAEASIRIEAVLEITATDAEGMGALPRSQALAEFATTLESRGYAML